MSVPGVILVGTDLAEAADEAVRQAHRYGIDRGTRLVVCHVIPNPVRVNILFPQLNMEVARIAEALDRAADAVRNRVVALTGRSPDDFEVIVEDGVPEEVLVRRAEHDNAELVVVGATSGSAMHRVLGGVAQRVVRHAHVPVLVARKTIETNRVLVATDFSDSALAAVNVAAAEARKRNARLFLVHSLSLVSSNIVSPSTHPFAPDAGVQLSPQAVEKLRRDAEARMTELLRLSSVEGELHVLDGQAGEAIVGLADQLQPELIVVGTVGRTGLRRLLLGSVAEFVVRYAGSSTLVVRASSQ